MKKVLLGQCSEVPPGRAKSFVKNGHKVLVVNDGGNFRAYKNFCPHMGGALRGDSKTITCTWHGACFNAKTGDAHEGVAEGTTLDVMEVVVENDELCLLEPEQVSSPWSNDF